MNNSNTLMNPAPKDIRYSETQNQSDENVQVSKEQLKLNVPSNQTPVQRWVGSTRTRMKKRLDVIEVAQFWKNPSVPFMIVSFVVNILILLVGGIILFERLPPEIQLFYNPVEETWIPENKAIHIIIVPVLLVTMFLLQYRFIRMIFRDDRRLGITISWIMTLMNVFLLIAVSQIVSFYT
jgi:hypothetical protein